MRRIVTILAIVMMLAMAPATVIAQTFEEYTDVIEGFAAGVASSLPLNSSVGLTWSDAYIGQFPRFGVGATVGFSTVPYATLEPIFTTLGLAQSIESSVIYGVLDTYGAPLPAYTVEARLGGFMVPFDIGVKIGTIPEGFDTTPRIERFSFDYLLVGADVRVGVVRGRGPLPKISIGAGYNHLDARIGLEGLATGGINLTDFTDPRDGVTTYSVQLTDPTIEYFWRANIVDFTAQASMDLLFLTPYIGAGASIGFGSAGGGLTGELTTTPALSETELAAINAAFEALGTGMQPALGPQGLHVTADMPAGWAFRAYGGVSFNLLIVRLDLTGMYDFLGKNYGATVGLRIQF